MLTKRKQIVVKSFRPYICVKCHILDYCYDCITTRKKKVQSALKSYRDLYFAILFSVFYLSLNSIRYSLRVATYETLIQYKTLRKTELCHFPRDTNILCSHFQHKLRCFSFSTSEAEKILSCSLYHRATLLLR